MATVTKENIGLLHEKLTVKLEKTDYLPSFEKALKEYSKKANIPGFRKGMVPAGLIKKMYGTSLFTDEILKTVDKQLIDYLQNDKLDIFAQPLPLETDFSKLDVNNPADYSFEFEVGMKPEFDLPDLAKMKTTRYVVTVTDEMIAEAEEALRTIGKFVKAYPMEITNKNGELCATVMNEVYIRNLHAGEQPRVAY